MIRTVVIASVGGFHGVGKRDIDDTIECGSRSGGLLSRYFEDAGIVPEHGTQVAQDLGVIPRLVVVVVSDGIVGAIEKHILFY